MDGAGVKPVNKQQGQLALLSMEKCKRWGPQGTGLGWFYFVISDLEGEGSGEHEGNSAPALKDFTQKGPKARGWVPASGRPAMHAQ